jgi:hypothetical protein
MRILLRAAELADERAEQTAQIISAEAGKTITEARGEAGRPHAVRRLKASGLGKEGPRSAVAEMTDVKTVILHGRPW